MYKPVKTKIGASLKLSRTGFYLKVSRNGDYAFCVPKTRFEVLDGAKKLMAKTITSCLIAELMLHSNALYFYD